MVSKLWRSSAPTSVLQCVSNLTDRNWSTFDFDASNRRLRMTHEHQPDHVFCFEELKFTSTTVATFESSGSAKLMESSEDDEAKELQLPPLDDGVAVDDEMM